MSLETLLLLAAGFFGGVLNAIAGGGRYELTLKSGEELPLQ